MPNTVQLKTYSDEKQKEGIAAAAITPGELIEKDASGQFQAHSTAGGNVIPRIAIEESYIGNDIDTDYASGDQVRYNFGQPGEEYYMFLAAGENASDGDLLESDGAGALQVHTPQAVDEGGTATYDIYTNEAHFVAAEDKDNSGGTSRVRIKVEVL